MQIAQILPNRRPKTLPKIGLRLLFIMLCAAALVYLFGRQGVPRDYFLRQDLFILPLAAALYGTIAVMPKARLRVLTAVRLRWPAVALASVTLALLLWAGTYAIMNNYALTRDEHMVLFDMVIFREGALATRVSPEWREYAVSLVPAFLMDVPGGSGWVSSYMPGNSALRALFALGADPALMNPILAGLGACALYSVAQKLFPNRTAAQGVALLLYFTSMQMLASAMTTYAMTGHMALNLIWLACFMRGGRSGHLAAIVTGFLATGLHQVIFHPLFVLPFIEQLRREGRWQIALTYVAAYVLIGLFWLSYPGLVLQSLGVAAEVGQAGGGGLIDYMNDRVLPLLLVRDPEGLSHMLFNLLRFVTWQNLALVPLVIAAIPIARQGIGITGPLYAGILLTLGAMFVLIPYQGHGWGYRYLHGLLGSFALLGALGWERLRQQGESADALLAIGTAVTVALTIPFLLWKTHDYVAPYARVDKLISGMGTDFVVVDTHPPSFAIDQVRNDPKLQQRPLRISSRGIGTEQIRWLCSRGSVSFIDRAAMRNLGLGSHLPPKNREFELLKHSLDGLECRAR